MGTFQRGAGILLHPTSLPSSFGIGELGGPEIFKFIDLLVQSNQKYWQILPLGPTGYGDSPYQSFSSFAGNPLLISISDLLDKGLLKASDVPPVEFSKRRVEYGRIYPFKEHLLRVAFERFKDIGEEDLYSTFVRNNLEWLDNYAIFQALKQKFHLDAWSEWPEEYRHPNTEIVNSFADDNQDELNFVKFVQFVFYQQWIGIKNYANSKGIEIIGDTPIYVAYDSADCWAYQNLFKIFEDGTLECIAGVPPDYFSETGQLWGNPIYNWEECEKTGFQFWKKRIKKILELVDIVRIDHFRGFASYWQVPIGEPTAVNGSWEKGPGSSLFNELKHEFGELPFIAEDLGNITEEVTNLLKQFSFYGMAILQYGFSRNQDATNKYLPHNVVKETVIYTGTHDNDTSLGWFASAPREVKEHFLEYTNSTGEDIISDLIKLAHNSIADIAIIPMQDLLRRKNGSRMNFPGKAFGNWQWRFSFADLTDHWISELADSTVLSNRT